MTLHDIADAIEPDKGEDTLTLTADLAIRIAAYLRAMDDVYGKLLHENSSKNHARNIDRILAQQIKRVPYHF